MRVRARVLNTYQEGIDPVGTFVPVHGGAVTLDSGGDVRSTLDLTTSGEWGTGLNDPFTPYGNEVFVERGIDYGNGETEWVSLGYFRINAVEMDGENGTIRVTGGDRMSQVVDHRIGIPVQYADTASHADIFHHLIKTATEAPYPDATIEFDYDASSTQLGVKATTEDDRRLFLENVVEPLGKVMFWDHRGVLVIRSNSVSGPYVFHVNTGAEGVLVSLRRQIQRDRFYNGVLARGGPPEDGGPPAYGLVTNDNPDDPLMWGGRFGRVIRFYESDFITTDDQAIEAAEIFLDKYTGLPYDVDMSTVPNPALEPLDVIRITLTDGTFEDHVIDELVIPLTAEEPLKIKTRTKRVSEF